MIGAVAPVVVFTEILFEERGVVEFQEFGIAAAAGTGQVGFVLHGVAFQQGLRRIEADAHADALLAREEHQHAVDASRVMGHLAQVAAFVGGELGLPVHRIEGFERRGRHQFDAFGRPDHGSVAVHVVRVQDHRYPFRLDAESGQVGGAVTLEGEEEFPGEGVDLAGVDDFEMLTADMVPARTGRVAARLVVLGAGRQGSQHRQGEEDEKLPGHLFNWRCKFIIFA